MVPQKQPRFQLSQQCKYKKAILGEENRLYFPTLEQRTKNDPGFHKCLDDEADKMRRDVQEHLCAVVASQIEIGGIGAVPTADTDADGYDLVRFNSEPYNCQESHQLIVEGKYLNPVKRAPKWYTSRSEDLFDKNLVNQPTSKGCLRKTIEKEVMKIRKEDYDYIMEEILIRREALEDPDYESFTSCKSN